MTPRFVIQTAGPGLYVHIDGKMWAKHPIAARWFESHEAADNVIRREFSRVSSVMVRQLTDDCQGVRL